MTDILARLNNPPFGMDSSERNLIAEAASEIGRLRAELDYFRQQSPEDAAHAQRVRQFQLGDIVEFSPTFRYYDEWRGVRLKIVEMRLDPQGGQWVSAIEGEQRHRGNGVYDGETTDIDAHDLVLVERVQSPADSAAAPASANVEAVAAVLKGWLGDYLAATPPLGKISKALAAAALGSAADREADAADAATLRGFLSEHGMTPSMMASEAETLRADVSAYALQNTNLRNDLVQMGMARDIANAEVERLRAHVERLTVAAAPLVSAARAMYQPGHCGGQSPQDWPKSWRVWIVAEDREKRDWEPQWHTPLTVGDFRALEGAVELARAGPAADQPKLQDDQAAAQHEIMMRVFDWAYLHATVGAAWPDHRTAERAIELAKDRPPTQADADTIKATSRFPEASA